MNSTPIDDITPLLLPLIPKLKEDVLLAIKKLKIEEENLALLILEEKSIEEIRSQRYTVLFYNADVAYAKFKLKWLKEWLKDLLAGNLK